MIRSPINPLTLAVSLIVIIVTSSSALSPIIFVPGSFCSLLEVRINVTLQPKCPRSLHNQWMLLWLNLRFVEPQLLPCYRDVFKLVYNASLNAFEAPPGVETRLVPGSDHGRFLQGLLWEYIGLDKFQLHFTKKHGYTDGRNLRSIAYDFRRGTVDALRTFNDRLRDLIVSTYAENTNQSVHLVSHSTGGSMVLYFLSEQSQAWKDQYVRGWISLSGNLAGEVDNIANVAGGFLSPVVPRTVIQSWDFFAWRLPEPLVYGSQRVIVETPSRNYTANDMRELLLAAGADALARLYPQTSSVLAALPPPNVDTYCFYGANVSTPIGYRSKSDRLADAALEIVHGGGDGEQDDTTNMSCRLWRATMEKKYTLEMRGFERVSHLELVGSEAVLTTIDRIIVG